ncbi:xylitol dehydrogenase [Flagelloscypha sp. PMI_526]|nr:xylitol dehydrogenase [Flagelloscypha sp. PMI_526]
MSLKSDSPSFVLKAVEDVAYEDRPIPELGDHDVLVEIRKTGICGSDVHYLTHGRIGLFSSISTTLSELISGVIAKVGTAVTNVKVGDRVAVEPGASCKRCDDCKAGKYNLCTDMVFAATPSLPRYYKVPSDLTYILPENMTFEDGAMIEPLAVGVHSVSYLGNFKANQNIVVTGCGPVGLVTMAVAKALGARRIIAVDIVPSRLDFAKRYVAAEVYAPPKMEKDESKVDYARRNASLMKDQLGLTDRGDSRIDLVVECSGVEVSIQTAFHVIGTGGTVLQVGMGAQDAAINMGALSAKEVTYKGSFRYGPGDYSLAIALVSSGKIDLKPLVTHRFTFDQALVAFKATKAGKSEDGKDLIKAMISGVDHTADQA